MNQPVTAPTTDLSWLVDSFVAKTPGVDHAVVVSSDGLLVALSDQLERSRADQFAAIAAGLSSLTQGAARVFELAELRRVIVEMDDGFLFLSTISDGSSLAVLCRTDCDIGLVGYEMTLFAQRAGSVLTPALISGLRARLRR